MICLRWLLKRQRNHWVLQLLTTGWGKSVALFSLMTPYDPSPFSYPNFTYCSSLSASTKPCKLKAWKHNKYKAPHECLSVFSIRDMPPGFTPPFPRCCFVKRVRAGSTVEKSKEISVGRLPYHWIMQDMLPVTTSFQIIVSCLIII